MNEVAEIFSNHKEFFHKFRRIVYNKGEVILHPSDNLDHIYFLEEGYVESYTISEDGIQFTNLIYKPNEIFPYCWAIENITNEYYFNAITEVVVYIIPRGDFLNYITKSIDGLLDAHRYLEYITLRICERMEQMVFGTAYNKVAARLKFLAKRFGIRINEDEFLIPFNLTHENIANSLGLTRETTSTQMKRLEKKGYIRHDKLNIVLNIKKFNKHKKVVVNT